MELSRDRAWALVTEWTASESLRKHMLAVEAAVRGYAREFGEDEDGWGGVALLHGFAYERLPAAARLLLLALSRSGESPVSRYRGVEGARVPRVGHARNPVACGIQRRP